MRKELTGLFFAFLVIFTTVALVTYHPQDPSLLKNAAYGDRISNSFGIAGAQVAGILVGMFGGGVIWIPILLLFLSWYVWARPAGRTAPYVIIGGTLLILTTGSLLTLHAETLTIWGRPVTSGGILGTALKSVLVTYTGKTGAAVILALLWLMGLIVATGFSLVAFFARFRASVVTLGDALKTTRLKRQERRAKRLKREKTIQRQKARPPAKQVQIKGPEKMVIKAVPTPKQVQFDFMKSANGFHPPSIKLLNETQTSTIAANNENLLAQSKLLEKKLEDFGVLGNVETVLPGPVVTTFEYAPAPGVKINRIVALSDDLALALRAASIRIVAPIPGKSVIGIEIPNPNRDLVHFKDIVVSKAFEQSKSALTICLGKDIMGQPVVAPLEKMPHLLIAGATGTGKSVALNAMVCSFLYKANPDQVKLIMIDPKRIELSLYDGIPHLITPVVTDVKKATNALFWAVKEMERRYELLSSIKVRNISQYNQKIKKLPAPKPTDEDPQPFIHQPLPYVVVIIDELADLMMVASKEVEIALARLAQMARAAGIHLILATQRPSVDVLTGTIKANFPTRLTFQVSSKTDSRTIIDTNGAESLLGNGDMLFLPPGTAKLQRVHGAFISEEELIRVIDFLKAQKPPEYDESVTAAQAAEAGGNGDTEYDERYDEAVALVAKKGQASISMVQRHLRIGYNRAARIIETMEQEGVVGPADGAKPRQVLVSPFEEGA